MSEIDPQAELAALRRQLQAATYRETLLKPYEDAVWDLRKLLDLDGRGEQDPWKTVAAIKALLGLLPHDIRAADRTATRPTLCPCGCRILRGCQCNRTNCACAADCIVCEGGGPDQTAEAAQ